MTRRMGRPDSCRAARIGEEQRVVEAMVRLYCRHHHGSRDCCAACRELADYARARLSRCRFGEGKPTCRQCPAHCYRKDMAGRMREVMRWAGPRMILYHPLMALRHMLRGLTCKVPDYHGKRTEIQQPGRT